jgi:hypothetical protein
MSLLLLVPNKVAKEILQNWLIVDFKSSSRAFMLRDEFPLSSLDIAMCNHALRPVFLELLRKEEFAIDQEIFVRSSDINIHVMNFLERKQVKVKWLYIFNKPTNLWNPRSLDLSLLEKFFFLSRDTNGQLQYMQEIVKAINSCPNMKQLYVGIAHCDGFHTLKPNEATYLAFLVDIDVKVLSRLTDVTWQTHADNAGRANDVLQFAESMKVNCRCLVKLSMVVPNVPTDIYASLIRNNKSLVYIELGYADNASAVCATLISVSILAHGPRIEQVVTWCKMEDQTHHERILNETNEHFFSQKLETLTVKEEIHRYDPTFVKFVIATPEGM